MSISFQYVRRLDDPGIILTSGYSDLSGQFDDTVYELVAGPLPQSYQKEDTRAITDRVSEKFEFLYKANKDLFSTAERDAIVELSIKGKRFSELDDEENLKALLEAAKLQLPPAAVPFVVQLLEEFPDGA